MNDARCAWIHPIILFFEASANLQDLADKDLVPSDRCLRCVRRAGVNAKAGQMRFILSRGKRMKTFRVAVSTPDWIGSSKRLIAALFATAVAFTLITVVEAPFARPAHAQVTCAGVPHNESGTGFERWFFDTDAGTCINQTVGGNNPPTNGFLLVTDDDDLVVRASYTAGTEFDLRSAPNDPDVASHSISPTSGFGGVLGSPDSTSKGVFEVPFDAATGETFNFTTTITKGGTSYSITLTLIANDGVNHQVSSMTVTGGAFNAVPAVPTAQRDDDAIRRQTQRVIANFLARRADQITAAEPNIIDRLRRPEAASGSSGPVDVTANGTGSNNQVAFATSMRQMANAARADKENRASKFTKTSRPPLLEGAMALGAYGAHEAAQPALFSQPYDVASGFDIWAKGEWARVDDGEQESDLGLLHFGVDYRVNKDLLIGIMGQSDWMDQNTGSSGISAQGQGWMAGPYIAARLHQNLYFDARAAWGESDNKVNALGTFTDSFQTERWLARGQLTGDFSAGDWTFNPHAAISYFREDQNTFVNKLGILIPGQAVSLGRVTFGPKASYRWNTSSAVIEPHVAVTGIWDFDRTDQVNVRTGQALGTDEFRGRIEGGVSAFLTNGLAIEGSAFYDGIGAGDFDGYGGSLSISAPLLLPTNGFGDVAASQVAGISVDVLALRRDELRKVPFTGPRDGNPANPFVAFTSDELSGEDFTPGIRATVAASVLDQPMEFSGFFMNTMELASTKLNLGQEPGNPANTNVIHAAENDPGASIASTNSDNIFGLAVHHQTKLYGAEVSALNAFGVSGLSVGPRAIYYGEELATQSIEEEDDLQGGTDPNPDRDQVTVRTDNRLLGIQAGLQGMFALNETFSVGGSVKGGLYLNRVDRQRTFRSQNVAARQFSDETNENVFAQAVEVNPRLEVRLSETITLSAAGTFMWLNNVSEAVSHYGNVTDTSDNDVRADEDVIFYGGSLGLKIALDDGLFGSGSRHDSAPIDPAADLAGASYEDLDERIAELESTTIRKGNPRLTMGIYGWLNYGLLAYDDGVQDNAAIVNFAAARSRVGFEGSAKIARGWSAGYNLEFGISDADSNDISQFTDEGDEIGLALRQSVWWLRSHKFGMVTVGNGSTATDNIILNDTGGIIPGVQNIATIGGGLLVRHSDEIVEGSDAIIDRTTMSDFAGGGSIDTLRRNMVRYDAPRIDALGGRFYFSAAWGEDDFYDVAVSYDVNWNDFKLRSGIGYLHDTDEPAVRVGIAERDRQEFKGSASLIHVPSGIFVTAAFVHREFAGTDPSNQAIFGENTTGLVTPPGSNRPDLEYRYFASGLRAQFSNVGDTTIYGEYGRVDDGITGLREAGLFEVTDSRLEMVGVAVSQDFSSIGMDVYAGARHFRFQTEGVINQTSPEPLTDHMQFFAGSRIKF